MTGLRIDPLGAADAAAATARRKPSRLSSSGSSSPTRGSATEYSSRSRPPPGMPPSTAALLARFWTITWPESRAVAAARPVSADPAAQGLHDAGVVARCHGPRAFRQLRDRRALEQAFLDEPVWYLQALGVHPDAQRRGVGAALLSAGLAVVDADHAACHLHIGPGERRVLPAVGIQAHPTCVLAAGRRADVLRDDPPGVDAQGWPSCHLGLVVCCFRGAEQVGLVPSAATACPCSPGGQALARAP